jgi:hypothetical protein
VFGRLWITLQSQLAQALGDEADWTAARAIWAEIDPHPGRSAALCLLVRGFTPIDPE